MFMLNFVEQENLEDVKKILKLMNLLFISQSDGAKYSPIIITGGLGTSEEKYKKTFIKS